MYSKHSGKPKMQRGFTLVELMITITIAGILMAMAVPSFTDFVANNRIISETNKFIGTISFARVEAVRLGQEINVSAIDDSDNTNEWGGGGYGVWQDANNDGNYDVGEEVRQVDAINSKITLDGSTGVSSFTFSADGLVSATEIFHICDDRTGETGRVLTLLGGGGISVANFTCI